MLKRSPAQLPLKVILGYLVLLGISVMIGWSLYNDSLALFRKDYDESADRKAFMLSNLLSNISRVERISRATAYSTKPGDFDYYKSQQDSLLDEIDSVRTAFAGYPKIELLDSVKILLDRKTENIRAIREVRGRYLVENDVRRAIHDMNELEDRYRKLQLTDFIANPQSLDNYQKKVITDYVEYLNENIPDDSTNTLTKKQMDSILVQSRQLLGQVRTATSAQKKSFERQEKNLLRIENEISGQINIILKTVEQAITVQNQLRQEQREQQLADTYDNVSWLAVAGLTLSLVFVLLVVMDFSKSQQYKKQLEKANNQASALLANREQLISTVSHDLKTPVSTINGYSEILARANLSPQQQFYIENIRRSSEYIQNLASDLASLTQLEAGKITLENQSFLLHQLLEETARSVAMLHQKKNIALIFDFDPQLNHRLTSDPYRIRQIAYNLIGNAYKFTAEGHVKLITKRDNDRLEVWVEDTGIGIEPESIERVFDSFTQANATIEKRFGGTGLGLSISRKLAEILGGSLTVRSVPNQGSIFKLTLPYKPGVEPPNQESIVLAGKTAAVVDDDPSLLSLIFEVMKREGVSVTTFESANDAINYLRHNPADFVLTDIQMPEKDGFWLNSEIRKLRPHIPVIALTGAANLHRQDFENSGFAGWVQKPFTAASLSQAIRSTISSGEFTQVAAKVAVDADYDLDSVRAFFSDEAQVETFLSGIRESVYGDLPKLADAISNEDAAWVRGISHKMLSVFRQLHHRKIMDLLERIESNPHGKNELFSVFSELESNIDAFFKSVSLPVHNP